MLQSVPMPRRSAPLIADPEEAVQAFSQAGVDLRFDRIKEPAALDLRMDAFPMGATQLVCTTWGTESWSKVEMSGCIGVVINANASSPSVFTTAGEAIPADSRFSPIIQPGRDIEVFRTARAPLFVLTAEMSDVERLQREVTGADCPGLDFEPSLSRRTPEGRRFHRVVSFVANELKVDPTAVNHPIVRRQLDDVLLGAILSLPGAHQQSIEQAKGVASSGVVRRAEEFMEANLGRPIGMSDVAAECACSRTKLFQAFKKERQWTPLQFLVRRRMERARRRLLAPADGVTVSAVSLDCGYPNFSRFAQQYRKLYGETPSMTLNRALLRALPPDRRM